MVRINSRGIIVEQAKPTAPGEYWVSTGRVLGESGFARPHTKERRGKNKSEGYSDVQKQDPLLVILACSTRKVSCNPANINYYYLSFVSTLALGLLRDKRSERRPDDWMW